MKILSAQEVRIAESQANDNGNSFETMMEAAGAGCADFILRNYPDLHRIVILIGKGKNGGDGYVCARRLAAAQKSVTLIRLFSAPSDPLSEKMRDLLPADVRVIGYDSDPVQAEKTLQNSDLIVDAIFGIGFKGRFPENVQKCITFANAARAVRIAIDLPSGIDENTVDTTPFSAHVTLSMLCLKKEQIYAPFRGSCGRTEVIPIGIPCDVGSELNALTRSEAASLLPLRPFDANKGSFGNVLILGGSRNMPGAPLLAAAGALRSGAGLVSLGIPSENLSVAAAAEPECLFMPLPTDENGFLSEEAYHAIAQNKQKYSAIVLGNGMGQTDGTRALVEKIICTAECPVVLDADGINAVSANIHILNKAKSPLLLTPHPGEMSRLTGKSVKEINRERESVASGFAVAHGVFVLLKGANTVIASPDGTVYINGTGCAALARGGSGDVLAGMIGALLAQKTEPMNALTLASYIHGRAGELSEQRCSSFSATTKENIASIADAFRELTESK